MNVVSTGCCAQMFVAVKYIPSKYFVGDVSDAVMMCMRLMCMPYCGMIVNAES